MPSEGIEHRRIRKRVEKDITALLRKTGRRFSHRVVSAHERGAGTISLYVAPPSRGNKMSDADIAVVDGRGRVVSIVEVKDRDVRPKDLFGIIGATSLSTIARHRKIQDSLVDGSALYIVCSSRNLAGSGSKKKEQIEMINRNLARGTGTVSRVVICTDTEDYLCTDRLIT